MHSRTVGRWSVEDVSKELFEAFQSLMGLTVGIQVLNLACVTASSRPNCMADDALRHALLEYPSILAGIADSVRTQLGRLPVIAWPTQPHAVSCITLSDSYVGCFVEFCISLPVRLKPTSNQRSRQPMFRSLGISKRQLQEVAQILSADDLAFLVRSIEAEIRTARQRMEMVPLTVAPSASSRPQVDHRAGSRAGHSRKRRESKNGALVAFARERIGRLGWGEIAAEWRRFEGDDVSEASVRMAVKRADEKIREFACPRRPVDSWKEIADAWNIATGENLTAVAIEEICSTHEG